MITLALDLGTNLGWALRPTESKIIYGTQSFKINTRFEGGGMQWVKFRRWLADMIYNANITQVAFEEVRNQYSLPAQVYGGFLAHLTEYCEEKQTPIIGIPVKTIKTFMVGKGNASKEAMVAAAIDKGYPVADHNQADAIAILLYMEHEFRILDV